MIWRLTSSSLAGHLAEARRGRDRRGWPPCSRRSARRPRGSAHPVRRRAAGVAGAARRAGRVLTQRAGRVVTRRAGREREQPRVSGPVEHRRRRPRALRHRARPGPVGCRRRAALRRACSPRRTPARHRRPHQGRRRTARTSLRRAKSWYRIRGRLVRTRLLSVLRFASRRWPAPGHRHPQGETVQNRARDLARWCHDRREHRRRRPKPAARRHQRHRRRRPRPAARRHQRHRRRRPRPAPDREGGEFDDLDLDLWLEADFGDSDDLGDSDATPEPTADITGGPVLPEPVVHKPVPPMGSRKTIAPVSDDAAPATVAADTSGDDDAGDDGSRRLGRRRADAHLPHNRRTQPQRLPPRQPVVPPTRPLHDRSMRLRRMGIGAFLVARVVQDFIQRASCHRPVRRRPTSGRAASSSARRVRSTSMAPSPSTCRPTHSSSSAGPGGPNAGDWITSPDGGAVYARLRTSTWRRLPDDHPLPTDARLAIEVLSRNDNADRILSSELRRRFVELDDLVEEGTGNLARTRYDISLELERFADRFPLQWNQFRSDAIPSASADAVHRLSFWLDEDNVLVRVEDDARGLGVGAPHVLRPSIRADPAGAERDRRARRRTTRHSRPARSPTPTSISPPHSTAAHRPD